MTLVHDTKLYFICQYEFLEKYRRKKKKFTQAQLSKRSDVSLGSLKRFERTGEISLSSLIKISFALGCEGDFDELFSKKGYASIQEVIDEQR